MENKKFTDQAEELLKSEKWEDRYGAMELIKKNSIGIKETDELSFVFGLIKRGLKDKDGRVRNNSVYAFKDFRCGLLFSSYSSIEIVRELYDYALNEKDSKTRRCYLRCLNCMKSAEIEFKFRDIGAFEEYKEIIDFLDKEVGDKYDIKYSKNPKLHKKFEELARKICILERLNKPSKGLGVDENMKKIWKEDEFLAEELGNAYYDSILEESEEFIKKDSKENVGYNMFVDGIRVGLDIIMPLLDEEMKNKIKDKIKKMLTKRAFAEEMEDELWSKGSYIESINPTDSDYKEKMKYFEEKSDDKKEYKCKKCNKLTGKHNLYWHEGMCNDCFFNEHGM